MMWFLSPVNEGLPYHLETLFLLTSDQVLDTVIPGTAFGLSAAVSGPILNLPSQSIFTITQRLPAVWLWLWLMSLQFCLQNQWHTNSIEEDLINKPWRPLPAKRLTQKQAIWLLLVTYVLNAVMSWHLGVLYIHFAWIILGTIYNDFSGGDHSGLLRNGFCGALGCCVYGSALSIALGHRVEMSWKAWQWTLMMTFGIIGTTIHTQDFRDEVGDRARGRKTLVLEMGRMPAAWSVIVAVAFWSVCAPLVFFESAWITGTVLMVFAGHLVTVSFQTMGGFEAKRDRRMYKIWCLWIGICCGIPALVRASDGMASARSIRS
jgi:4-hydroxybenzoate polyprenyltransferase